FASWADIPFPNPTDSSAGDLLNGIWIGTGKAQIDYTTNENWTGYIFLHLATEGQKLFVKTAITLPDSNVVQLWLDGEYDIVTREDRNFVLLNNVTVGEIIETSEGTTLYLSYFDIAAG